MLPSTAADYDTWWTRPAKRPQFPMDDDVLAQAADLMRLEARAIEQAARRRAGRGRFWARLARAEATRLRRAVGPRP